MATVEQLMERYSKDADFRARVDSDIKSVMARRGADLGAFMALGKKYGLTLSLAEAPKYLALAKRNGLIK